MADLFEMLAKCRQAFIDGSFDLNSDYVRYISDNVNVCACKKCVNSCKFSLHMQTRGFNPERLNEDINWGAVEGSINVSKFKYCKTCYCFAKAFVGEYCQVKGCQRPEHKSADDSKFRTLDSNGKVSCEGCHFGMEWADLVTQVGR